MSPLAIRPRSTLVTLSPRTAHRTRLVSLASSAPRLAGPITGVVQGFVPDGTVNMVGYRAGGTVAYVLVNTDPDTLYEIQENVGAHRG